MNTPKFFALITAGFIFTSCSEDTPVKETPNAVIEVDTTDVFGSERFEFVLPRPFALAASFQEAGMSYAPNRTNPVENVTKYNTKGAQLINFGVYSTDLVYNIINEQPQQTMLYFNTLKDLADKFGMGSIFTEDDLALQIEQNISNREVLEGLLVDVHERSQEYLEDNDMRYLSAIQFSGAWVEGMYLASLDFSKKDPAEVGHKISDQMTLVKNTIKGLEMYPNRDESINQTLEELKSFEAMYQNFESVLATDGVGFPELTQDEINQIATKITAIRSLIIA
jgi:hypothetical protein